MTHEDNPANAWWFELDDEQRAALDESARNSILELPRYPFWSPEIAAELGAWKDLEVEVLTVHADWISSTRARVLDRAERWNTVTCRAQARRDGDLAAPPEWIGEMSERLTPPWKLRLA